MTKNFSQKNRAHWKLFKSTMLFHPPSSSPPSSQLFNQIHIKYLLNNDDIFHVCIILFRKCENVYTHKVWNCWGGRKKCFFEWVKRRRRGISENKKLNKHLEQVQWVLERQRLEQQQVELVQMMMEPMLMAAIADLVVDKTTGS